QLLDADIACLQEVRADELVFPAELRELEGYELILNPAKRKGYSGTAIYTRARPKRVNFASGIPEFDEEGRWIEAEFADFTLLNVYIPHGSRDKSRLGHKLRGYEHL